MANPPTPAAVQSQGNEEQSNTATVRNATSDVATPSSTVEPTTQPKETPDKITNTNRVTNDSATRPTDTETSNTPRLTLITPAAEDLVTTQSKDLTTTQTAIDDSPQQLEEPSQPESGARASKAPPGSETDPTASNDSVPAINKNSSVTRPIAQTEKPPSSSIREVEILPTPTEAATATTVPSVEDTGTPTPLIEPASTTAKPTKSAATRPRKRKSAAAGGESEAETGAETVAETDRPAKKRRAPRKKGAAVGADGDDQMNEAEGSGTVRPRARSQRKEKTTTPSRGSTDQLGEGNADETRSEDEGFQQEAVAKRPKRRRRRSITPEDAQEMTIDPDTWTIAQLTKDLKMGKRWDRYKDVETAERNRKRELQKQRLIKLGLLQEGEELPAGDGSEAGTPAPEPTPPAKSPTPTPPAPAATGISMRIDANGNIIVDESSLQHDRHREADMQRGTLLVQEENEFSKRMTQQTYMRRQPKANSWTAEDTEKFYHGLRMFGTDFNMISKLFGGAKDRRQVKLKFNREERAHPMAVNKCLIGEKVVPMDLEEIDGAASLEDSQTINDELARLREEREAEAQRVEEEIQAEARRKREELFGKKKGKNHHLQEQDGDEANVAETDEQGGIASTNANGRPRQRSERSQPQQHPGAKYGVGTDPDVIDETDLPTTSSSSTGKGGRASRGGRGGRRGGKAIFASGFGV